MCRAGFKSADRRRSEGRPYERQRKMANQTDSVRPVPEPAIDSGRLWRVRGFTALSLTSLCGARYWLNVQDLGFLGVVATPYVIVLALLFVKPLKKTAYGILLVLCPPALTLCLGLALLGSLVGDLRLLFLAVLSGLSHFYLFGLTIDEYRRLHGSEIALGGLIVLGVALVVTAFYVFGLAVLIPTPRWHTNRGWRTHRAFAMCAIARVGEGSALPSRSSFSGSPEGFLTNPPLLPLFLLTIPHSCCRLQ